MAITKETLKKHHFWILVGLTPILVLVAVFMITTGVGAKIDERNAQITKDRDALKGKESPKSEMYIKAHDKLIDQLAKKRTDLWKENWDRQIGMVPGKAGKDVQDSSKNLLRWPNSKLLTRFNYTADYITDKTQLKFGAKIPDDSGEDAEFKKAEVYLAEFSNPYLKDPAREPEKRTGMVDKVYPTAFAGGWTSVLRHVRYPASGTGPDGWGQNKPTSEQLWLALEDIWIQRAMLESVKSVNDQIGAFAKKTKPDETPLDRIFTSRVWELAIKVAPRPGDGRFVLTGTLHNKTDRLQLLGVGNTMVLNVWLSTAPNAQPVAFRIGGEFVAGGATIAIAQSDEHVLLLGTPVEEIAKVEQAFDPRTVPVRRIERLALGYKDSRHTAVALKSPLFVAFQKEEADAAKTATGGSESGAPMGTLGGGSAPPGAGSGSTKFPGQPGSAGGTGGGSSSAPTGQLEGGGDVAAVLDGNRKRYLDPVTQQVRRMPVAISIVVDQAYMQDVLLAYANCPMRFQITQVHWQRFRGTLGGTGSSGGFSPGGGDDIGGPARGNAEGSGGIKLGGGSFSGPPVFGPKPGGPMGFGGPMGPGAPPAFGPGGGGAFDGGGSLATISEGQLTAGLVELTVYGVVSLYEKYMPAEAPAP